MQSIPKSGKYFPNKFARIAILALEDVMGRNGIHAILNLANLPNLIAHLPPDNLEKKFDFADFSAINGALELLYGARGGRGLAQRAGRKTFNDALRNFGALAGISDLAFKDLPVAAKLRIGLPAVARIFNQTSDQHTTVVEQDKQFVFTVHACPVCWGRHTDKPACHMSAGLILEGLRWVSGGHEFYLEETRCAAMGDDVCEFVIQKEPIQ